MSSDINYTDNWISEYPKIKKYLEENPEIAPLFASTPLPKATWNEDEWNQIVTSLSK